MRKARLVTMNEEQRICLESLVRRHTTPQRLVLRARVVLAAAAGSQNRTIAVELGTSVNTVNKWRGRFARDGLDGLLHDSPRSGRPSTRPSGEAGEIVRRTLETLPDNGTHWSTRALSAAMNIPATRIHRIWKAYQIKPHLSRNFKLSNDPRFEEKLVDIVGLYMNPPENALVLSVDEKSQIQALDRTQKCLPLMPKYCATHTHDYVRHGTTTLFAALEVASGRLIGECMPQHRHQEWIKFLKRIDRETDRSLDLHLIVDNYATHKHENVKAWLARHPRFHIHFTPTSSSWLNMVERWFGELTARRVRRGTFRSVDVLVKAIDSFITAHNRNPKSIKWTAKADVILGKIARARNALHNSA